MFGWLKRHAGTEERAEGGFTDLLVAIAAGNAAGAAAARPAQAAAVEYGVGLLGRCFATAEVTPMIPALSPEELGRLTRSLLFTGNAVYLIDVDRDGVISLQPAASWDIFGGPRPATWRYTIDLSGPSRTVTRRVPADAVIHVRINTPSGQPWRGVSPLEAAGVSSDLLARLEASFRDESRARVGTLLPVAEGLSDDAMQGLKADLAAMRGNVALVESMSSGAGTGRANGPQVDWQPKRFGPNFPAANVELRRDVGANICAALGIPPILYAGGDGGSMREAYRQLLVSSIQPLAQVILAELSAKLERPFTATFRRLQAADIAARARAFNSLVQGGIEAAEARILAGLED